MAYSSGFTAVTGATYTAAQYNTNTRDNFTAIWVYTTAGDIAYATGATTLARLGIGAAGAILKSTGSAPSWLALGANGFHLISYSGSPTWVVNRRYISYLLNTDVALNAGEDAVRFRIPAAFDTWNIVTIAASRKSGTGVPSFGVRNVTDGVEVLSTNVTIDSGETDSSTAATPAVIDVAHDDVADGDQFAIDVDAAGTSTLYAYIEIGFQLP